MKRLTLVPGTCPETDEPGYCIVDVYSIIEPSKYFHQKERFFEVAREFFKNAVQQNDNFIEEEIESFISIFEKIHLLSMPDVQHKDGETALEFIDRKISFLRKAEQGLQRLHRYWDWIKGNKVARMYLYSNPEGVVFAIDILIIPKDRKAEFNMFEACLLYSKKQAREYVEDCYDNGWIKDKERGELFDEIDEIEDLPEKTKEEIEQDQAKHN